MNHQTLQRFLTKVKKLDDCWEWTGGKFKSGYGLFTLENKIKRAHRVSYQHFNTDIPKMQQVLHRCDNPGCVNPEHLFIGSHKENMADKNRKGRGAGSKGEDHFNHKLTTSQVLSIREDSGKIKDVAAKYSITCRSVNDIKKKRTWKHV